MNKSQILVLTAVSLLTSISCKRGNPVITLNEIKEPFTTHTKVIDDFLADPVDDNVKAAGIEELSKPNPVHLSWNYSDSNSPKVYTVKIAEENDLLNPYVVTTTNNYLDFYNSKLNTTYYYRVESGATKSEISTFSISDTQLRMINIDGVTNCRDLGGYTTTDDLKIKQGVIYRTARFNKSHETERIIYEITPKGIDTLKNQLHVKTEIDLRGNSEEATGQAYDGYIPGVRYKAYHMQYQVDNILLDNREVVKKLFDEVLSNPNSYPLDFHCSIGTDRTGCIAYTLLALCGVAKETLVQDYLLSNYGVIRSGRKFADIADTYPKTFEDASGTSLKEKAADVLKNQCDISMDTINKVRDLLIKK